MFTGALYLRLSRERCRLVADRPEDEERLAATMDLVETRRESSELDEALQLGSETLPIMRRVDGDEDKCMLGAMARRPACAQRNARSCGGAAACRRRCWPCAAVCRALITRTRWLR